MFRYQAGQCLLAIRHFVSIAQDIPLELTPISDCYSIDDFDIKGAQLSDIEFISRLDTQAEQIIKTISELLMTTRTLKQIRPPNDRISDLKQGIIDRARQAVTEIGQFLSLVEELKIVNIKSVTTLLTEFSQRRDLLYTTVNDLITKAKSISDPYVAPNILDKLLEVSFLAEKCLQDLATTVSLKYDL
jgi:hypothetical protein